MQHTTQSSLKKKKMSLLYLLLIALFLARSSSIREHKGEDKIKNPTLRLPLYRRISETSIPVSKQLDLDDARVKFIDSRLNSKDNHTKKSSHPYITTTSSPFQHKHSIDENQANVPLYPGESIGIGNYYTKIGLGTPTSDHLVVVDTGSSFSWVQCEPCAVYCHPQVGPRFDPASSKTYQELSCGSSQCSSLKVATLNSPMCTVSNTCVYEATYGDESSSVGYLSSDTLSFNAESLPGFVFGCGQENDGLFGKSAGLVGLAKNELSMFYQLSSKYGKSFSYCLPSATPLGKTGSGGSLSIGSGSSSSSGYKFTPMLSDSRDPTLYFLKLSGVSVSGRQLAVSASDYNVPTIIDSGTTISRLPSPVYAALRDELVRVVSSKYTMAGAFSILDSCFTGTSDEISGVVPSVQLIFSGGTELNLAPHNVLIEVEKGTTCLAFSNNSNLRDIAIIGNQQQQTFDVLYDVASSRIGFAAGGCS